MLSPSATLASLFFLLVLWPIPVLQQKPPLPSPGMQSPYKSGISNHTVFYIQRNKNANTVFYDARLDKSGRLDHDSPIDVYYIQYAVDGSRSELNYLERTLAYGYTSSQLAPNHYKIKLRAFPDRPVDLIIPRGSSTPLAYTLINGKKAILTNLYVEAKPRLYTSVVWVDLFGIDPETLSPVKERIINN